MTPIPPLSLLRQGFDAAGFHWADCARRRGERRQRKNTRRKSGDCRRRGQRRSPIERRVRPGPGLPPDDLTRAASSLPAPAGPTDRRRLPRCNNLLLFPQDRERLWQQRRQAMGCGVRWGAYRRFEDAGSHVVEHRIACRTTCGTRGCPDCMRRRRDRVAARAAMDAGVFVTLTVSSNVMSCRDAWLSVGEWVSALCQSMRRVVREEGQRTIDVRPESQEDALASWVSGGIERRPPGPLQYSWVVEPHNSGWPHIHMLIGADRISVEWLRPEWQRIVGDEAANVDITPVDDAAGAIRYLTAYVTKARLTLDILAVMHRKRIFGTTMPVSVPRVVQWSEDETTTPDEAARQVRDPRMWGVNEGWRVDDSSHAGCAWWARSRRWEDVAIEMPARRVVSDGPFIFDAIAKLPAALRRLADPDAFVGRVLDVVHSGAGPASRLVPLVPDIERAPYAGRPGDGGVSFKPREWLINQATLAPQPRPNPPALAAVQSCHRDRCDCEDWRQGHLDGLAPICRHPESEPWNEARARRWAL